MKTSEERTNIIKAMIRVQAAMKPVKKDRENKFAEGHKYATLDAILEAVMPILSDNEIFMTQEPETEILDGAVAISVTTRFFHVSGEFIEYSPMMFQLEKGAKMNLAQSSGSVITYIKRYSLTAALGISSDEDVDGVTPKGLKQEQRHQEDNQAEQMKKINDRINKDKKTLEASGADMAKLEATILAKEKVERIEMVAPLKMMGYYKFFVEKQKAAEKKKQSANNGPVAWGQK